MAVHLQQPSTKLDYRYLDSFPITAKINPVMYRLRLTRIMNIHLVFYVSLILKVR